ncbi:MAG: DUF4199 domain-containing protein [Bacteroidetes bacterium]|nr:MAG: DUF4199 domain-containing protein [Bacteroidota bacterium]
METPSIQKIALKWGLILAGVAIVFSVISAQTMTPDGVGAIGYVISFLSFVTNIAAGVFAIGNYRGENGGYALLSPEDLENPITKFFSGWKSGYATLGEGFKTGFFTYAISSVVGSVFSYIYAAFIDPEMPQRMVDMTLSQLESNPAIQDGQISMFENIYGAMFSPVGQLLTGLIGGLIFGAIIALIIAAIMKREAPLDMGDIEDIGE